jgi:hypothetical protein
MENDIILGIIQIYMTYRLHTNRKYACRTITILPAKKTKDPTREISSYHLHYSQLELYCALCSQFAGIQSLNQKISKRSQNWIFWLSVLAKRNLNFDVQVFKRDCENREKEVDSASLHFN